MLTKLLRELNRVSPFLWEIQTDGTYYTLLSEDSPTADKGNGLFTKSEIINLLKEILEEVR